jgi:hypothetical protein
MGEDVHRSIATGAKKRLEKRIGWEMIAIDTPRLLNRGGTIARDRLVLEGLREKICQSSEPPACAELSHLGHLR